MKFSKYRKALCSGTALLGFVFYTSVGYAEAFMCRLLFARDRQEHFAAIGQIMNGFFPQLPKDPVATPALGPRPRQSILEINPTRGTWTRSFPELRVGSPNLPSIRISADHAPNPFLSEIGPEVSLELAMGHLSLIVQRVMYNQPVFTLQDARLQYFGASPYPHTEGIDYPAEGAVTVALLGEDIAVVGLENGDVVAVDFRERLQRFRRGEDLSHFPENDEEASQIVEVPPILRQFSGPYAPIQLDPGLSVYRFFNQEVRRVEGRLNPATSGSPDGRTTLALAARRVNGQYALLIRDDVEAQLDQFLQRHYQQTRWLPRRPYIIPIRLNWRNEPAP